MRHPEFKYSITIQCESLALLAALRGLAWRAEKTQKKQVATKGTKEAVWSSNGHKATFYFTTPNSRDEFVAIAHEALVPKWFEVDGSRKDNTEPPE
jgi:hypothetical protein